MFFKLSEENRNEMRYYRDLAVSVEKRRKCRRNSADSGVMISSNDGSCQRKAEASEVVANKSLPTPDTNKDMVSADGSSSNEIMVSAEGSSGDSDHDNVFFEAEKSCSPLRERRNSYTIERSPDNETQQVAVTSEPQNSPIEAAPLTASESSSTPVGVERLNSGTVIKSPKTASESSKIPVHRARRSLQATKDSPISISERSKEPVPSERRNSYTVKDAQISASENSNEKVPRRNSYTIDPVSAVVSPKVPVVRERRNSYTLESPSPIMLQYMQSLEQHDPNKQCELFVESIKNYNVLDVADENQFEIGIEDKELSLEDLVSNSTESGSLKLSDLGMWDACSDETLHNFLNADLQTVDSLPSSICGSPVSVIPACNFSACFKSSTEQALDVKPAASIPVINRSCECICNAISNLEPLRSQVADTIFQKEDHFDDHIDDSFSRDFRYLDLSNFSYDSDCPEGRYSECSSVSLSKFLSGDKLPDGAESEYVAFCYMKEQLEQKHRSEFKRLLREQQKEHDNLKLQFNKVSSVSKHTPSPQSNYAYSGSVVLKKYTPTSGQSTPVKSMSVDEQRADGTCSRTNACNGSSNVVEMKKKMPVKKIKSPRPPLTVEQAASKINAAIRGYLTRRLFKTERVTLLVQTIKDCLATAVSLQNEANLGMSELDLQSRLLQQVCIVVSILSLFLVQT